MYYLICALCDVHALCIIIISKYSAVCFFVCIRSRTRRYHRSLTQSSPTVSAGSAAMQGYRAQPSFVVDFDQSVSHVLVYLLSLAYIFMYSVEILHMMLIIRPGS